MRIKKNTILITLLFVLSIGLIVMIRNNYQINSELKECNLKLLEKNIALGSAVWAITQCHKYTNERFRSDSWLQPETKRCTLQLGGGWFTSSVERVCVFCAVPYSCTPVQCGG